MSYLDPRIELQADIVTLTQIGRTVASKPLTREEELELSRLKSRFLPRTAVVKEEIPVQYTQSDKKCVQCAQPYHLNSNCPLIICNICYQPGHPRYKCPHKNQHSSIYTKGTCGICGTLGHSIEQCMLSNLYIPKKNLGRIRCIVCNKKGHLNCTAQKYESSSDSDDSDDD